ncbi:MAG TPA: hypothetical protein PKL31_04540 [Fulvivirga sp.]|nr:hypothetical protein [Fulvivirga sp.]
MRIKYLILALLAVLTQGCDTESNVEPRFEEYFIKYYGEQGSQEGIDVEVLADGGFILLGNSTANGNNKQIFLVRTDVLGNEIWSNTFGGPEDDVASDFAIDASENIVIGATIKEANGAFTDAMIYRIDPSGNKIDSAVYGTPNTNEQINSLMITDAGDIVIVGSTTNVDILKPGYNSTSDLHDIYSVKVNSNLVPVPDNEWTQIYGFPGDDYGQQIVEKPDGTFLFFGTSNRPSSNPQQAGFNMFLFPTDAQGSATSSIPLQLYGTLNNEMASQMSRTSNGGYVMIGTTNGSDGNDIFMARIRSNNDFLSATTLNADGNVTGTSIIESITGGFLVLGIIEEGGKGDIFLARTSSGNDWKRRFGGIDNDKASKVIQLDDGSIVMVGTIELESQTKMSLIKTNSKGLLIP